MSNDKYYDLTTTGTGSVFRPRLVTPQDGNKPYYAVSISGRRGKVDDTKHVQYEVTVIGKLAKEHTGKLIHHSEKGDNIVVGFVIGDAYPKLFKYKSGEKQGQTGVSMSGRLLRYTWIKVNDKLVYSAKAEREAEQAENKHQSTGFGASNTDNQNHSTGFGASNTDKQNHSAKTANQTGITYNVDFGYGAAAGANSSS